MDADKVIEGLRGLADPENVKGMARFGISAKGTLGVPVPVLRRMAKKIGRDHALAEKLWVSGLHEARVLAGFVDDWKAVTEEQMDRWVRDFDSWDVCDQVCSNLFDRTPMAYEKALEWADRKEEFVRRAAFAMMASLAVHDKSAPDSDFLGFLPVIVKRADDGRNFVCKAVNWALRQIGKRNLALNRAAIAAARQIIEMNSTSARWIASDALRELEGKAVQDRLQTRKRAEGRSPKSK
jgi:3-methyladenine DNA glycosylase AlkD